MRTQEGGVVHAQFMFLNSPGTQCTSAEYGEGVRNRLSDNGGSVAGVLFSGHKRR